jgi:hypothetical protein
MALNLTPPANVSELFEVGPVVHALAAGRQFRIETMRALHQSPTSGQWFSVYYEDKAVTGTQPIPEVSGLASTSRGRTATRRKTAVTSHSVV